jgi:hypothetical protein
MADQTATLIRREEVAEGTMAFHFEARCNSGWAGAILPVSKAWNRKGGRSHDDKAYV